jgi:hypothetical protein
MKIIIFSFIEFLVNFINLFTITTPPLYLNHIFNTFNCCNTLFKTNLLQRIYFPASSIINSTTIITTTPTANSRLIVFLGPKTLIEENLN